MSRQGIRFLCVCSLGGFLEEERREEENNVFFFWCVLFERSESVKGKELSLQLYGEAFQAYINMGCVIMYMCSTYIHMRVHMYSCVSVDLYIVRECN